MPISTLVHTDTEGLGSSLTRAKAPFPSKGENPKKVGMEVKCGFYLGVQGGRVGEAKGYHPAEASGPRGSKEELPAALEKPSSVHLLRGYSLLCPSFLWVPCTPHTEHVSPDTSGH